MVNLSTAVLILLFSYLLLSLPLHFSISSVLTHTSLSPYPPSSSLRHRVRLLRKEDQEGIEAELPATFVPFLESAVLNHNILCASTLYDNVTVTQLADLLKTDPKVAEKAAAALIIRGAIKGSISQMDGIIYFKTGLLFFFPSLSSSLPSPSFPSLLSFTLHSDATALNDWDDSIARLCHGIVQCSEAIKREAS